VAAGLGLGGVSSGGRRRRRARSERRGPEPGGSAPAEVAGMGGQGSLSRRPVTDRRREERRDVWERSPQVAVERAEWGAETGDP
jgi:hypothetical protein